MAFSGWPETRVLLALQDVASIEKTNTLYYVPNAILVSTSSGSSSLEKEDYFFGSFIDRDQCYNLLTSLVKVSKRLIDLHGPASVLENRNLILGYQFPRPELQQSSTFLSDSRSAVSPPRSDPRNAISPSRGISKETKSSMASSPPSINAILTQTLSQSPPRGDAPIIDNIRTDISGINNLTETNLNLIPVEQLSQADDSIGEIQNTSTSIAMESSESYLKESIKAQEFDDNDDSIILSTLFIKSGVADLDSFRLPGVSVSDLWHSFWINGQGYRYRHIIVNHIVLSVIILLY